MANEITVTGSLTGFKPSIMSGAIARAIQSLQFSMAGNLWSEGTLLVGTAATAVPLGQVTQPHWAFFRNNDTVNYCTLRNTFSQLDFCRFLAGEFFIGALDPGCVPFAVANTAPVLLEYLIFGL